MAQLGLLRLWQWGPALRSVAWPGVLWDEGWGHGQGHPAVLRQVLWLGRELGQGLQLEQG